MKKEVTRVWDIDECSPEIVGAVGMGRGGGGGGVPAAETTALKTATAYQAALRLNKRPKYLRHLELIGGLHLHLLCSGKSGHPIGSERHNIKQLINHLKVWQSEGRVCRNDSSESNMFSTRIERAV